MASANLDLVRSVYAAWEGGDYSSADWAHPEIEYVIPDGPAPVHSTGLRGMAEVHREWLGAWDEWRVKPQEYREIDAERVLVPFHFSGRGRASGLELGEIRTEGATLFHLRGGKVTRIVQYLDRGRAMAELGLAHDAGSPGAGR